MPRVVHFELTADDPERATRFYADVFGWDVQKWDGPEDYWLITTGKDAPGIDGAIMGRADGFPRQAAINTIDVESVDEVCSAIAAHGGEIMQPKTTIPGVGYLAYCKDTEGNIFGVMQRDNAAA